MGTGNLSNHVFCYGTDKNGLQWEHIKTSRSGKKRKEKDKKNLKK